MLGMNKGTPTISGGVTIKGENRLKDWGRQCNMNR